MLTMNDTRLLPYNSNSADSIDKYCVCGLPIKPEDDPRDLLGRPNSDNFFRKEAYDVSYQGQTKCPDYVLERISPQDLEKENGLSRKYLRLKIKQDPDIPHPQPDRLDFKDSDYIRGHMAAAANHSATVEEKTETFLYPNILPVYKFLEMTKWTPLEEHVQKTLLRNQLSYVNTTAFILTGPIFYDNHLTIGNGLWVPDSLFKAIAFEIQKHLFHLECYIFKNSEKPLCSFKDCKVSREEIQFKSGLKIFPHLRSVSECDDHKKEVGNRNRNRGGGL